MNVNRLFIPDCGRPVNRGHSPSIISKQNQGRGNFQATKSEPVEK